MRILMVSMFSNHFFNWTKQLEGEGHEIYWLDVYDGNTYIEKINFVNQFIGWRNKVKYPGRYRIKKYFPVLYNFINRFNQRDLANVFEEKLKEIKPDFVQSFEMFSSVLPIMKVMGRNPDMPWIYSVWGNDLFYFKKDPQTLKVIHQALRRIDFLFTDCARDSMLAKELGFSGRILGTYPTGGGYDFKLYDPYIIEFNERKLILIKGYQHEFGRCNTVLKALIPLKEKLSKFEIVIFGGNMKVIDFAKEEELLIWNNLTIYQNLSHQKVLKLMGQSKIYIGNSISDGMPNTLLEAMIMGAFPIQSNPGGATAEIVKNGVNGFLIEDPENSQEISGLIERILGENIDLEKAVEYNFQKIRPSLERECVGQKVREIYSSLERNLKSTSC